MKDSSGTSLPQEPRGAHFEHLAASLFPACGFFVEWSIKQDIEGSEIQELDSAASRWQPGGQLRIVAEAKGAGLHTYDLFTLLGRRHYLGFERAVLLYGEATPDRDSLLSDCFKPHAVWLHHLDPKALYSPGGSKGLSEFLGELCRIDAAEINRKLEMVGCISAWRFSFWIEKVLIDELRRYFRCHRDQATVCHEAIDILEKINERFFRPDCRDQSSALYESYIEHARLTRRAVDEKVTQAPGSELEGLSSDDAFKACMYAGAVPAIQACMYLEHRSRCLLLKAAVDMIMHKRNRTLGQATIFGIPKEDCLPASFRSFVNDNMDTDGIEAYPQVWQSYLFTWGGFLLKEKLEAEHMRIGEDAGVGPEVVERALGAFDQLFPTDNGWKYEQESKSTQVLKLLPAAFRGLGVARRMWVCGKQLDQGLTYLTRRDFSDWLKAANALLQKDSSAGS